MIPVITVGVTGHRPNRLSADRLPAIASTIDGIFRRIEGLSHRTPTLVSALAEGADRLAAKAAMARGWQVIAALPFPADDYETDFENPASREEYRDLLSRSRVTSCAAERAKLQDAVDGYYAASAATVDLSNLVIAIWDGRTGRQRAGTFDTIVRALERGKPVIWIHAGKNKEPCVLLAEDCELVLRGKWTGRSMDELIEWVDGSVDDVESVGAKSGGR